MEQGSQTSTDLTILILIKAPVILRRVQGFGALYALAKSHHIAGGWVTFLSSTDMSPGAQSSATASQQIQSNPHTQQHRHHHS
jgi:hypothetical protein